MEFEDLLLPRQLPTEFFKKVEVVVIREAADLLKYLLLSFLNRHGFHPNRNVLPSQAWFCIPDIFPEASRAESRTNETR